MDNLEEYVELVTDFCLNVGIRRQMEAFRGMVNVWKFLVVGSEGVTFLAFVFDELTEFCRM